MDDLTTLLADFRSSEAGLDRATQHAARARLMTHVLSSTATARPPLGRRPAVRIGIAATGVATLATVGALVVPALLPNPPTAAAVELLDRASTAAARSTSGVVPAPGDVLYRYDISMSVTSPLNGDLPQFREFAGHRCFDLAERWVPVDDEDRAEGRNLIGITEESARTPERPAAADPACFSELTEFEPGTFADPGPGGWQNPDRAFVATLPADADGLYERARADARDLGYGDLDAATFTLLTDLAGSDSPDLGPEIRSTLFRALAMVTGVDVVGNGTSLLGESGVLLGRDNPDGGRREVLVDPVGGTVLGKREVATDSDTVGVPEGTVYYESATRVSIVDAVGDRGTG